MFHFERKRFGKTVDTKLVAHERWSIRDTSIQGAIELMIPFTFTILAGMVIYNISQGRGKPGDFVFFIQYWYSLI